MRIAKHKVVSINYTLVNDDGMLLDSSQEHGPLAYIHGTGGVVPGLEMALEGKKAGERIQAVIPPEQAYGVRDESLVQEIARDRFDTDEEIRVGMRFHATDDHGARVINVVGVEGDTVVIDANHPLAGMTLHFDVTISAVRDATTEELKHGHVHGPGGHAH